MAELQQPIEVHVSGVAPVAAELRALHAYRTRMQTEVIALRDALDRLACDYAEQLDTNTKAAPYCAGAFNAYVTARRLHDRLLLLCEESAAQAATAGLALVPKPMTAEWLRSPAYDALMDRGRVREHGNNEAEIRSDSYSFRHVEAAEALGVWRWRGMQEHKELLLGIFEGKGPVLDFGGAAGPLGLGSLTVDSKGGDFVQLDDAPRPRVIFSSHMLEHVPDIAETLREMHKALLPGGTLVLHLPAWTCTRWRAGVHTSKEHGDHRWTFELGDRPGCARIDHLGYKVGFQNVRAWYCGDNSLMLIAEKST